MYTQVDGGLPASASSLLTPLVVFDKDSSQFLVQETVDPIIAMLNTVFGFVPGHKLNIFAGLNEYLSALLAMTQLQSLLNREQLLQVFMCIEATIPFRKPDNQGVTWPERLHVRSDAYVRDHGLLLDEQQVVAAVHRAVSLANNDVGGFSALDTKFFLKNTWNLLPEANPNLRKPGIYTLKV